ncbi:MAG: hypothetical protein LUC91_06770 [Prevotella sp.]|nr:hypothetical protein [Prevotella sp.]
MVTGSSPVGRVNLNKKEVLIIKTITVDEVKALLNAGILRNTNRGFVNKSGDTVGYYVAKSRRYIEDKYVDIAKKL